ncbi:hypothetical protein AcV5_000073 [Taiwanofungus camphoratus]|nr:hypothetical protein AcV5_000073 [Antrodia cinnamomea]
MSMHAPRTFSVPPDGHRRRRGAALKDRKQKSIGTTKWQGAREADEGPTPQPRNHPGKRTQVTVSARRMDGPLRPGICARVGNGVHPLFAGFERGGRSGLSARPAIPRTKRASDRLNFASSYRLMLNGRRTIDEGLPSFTDVEADLWPVGATGGGILAQVLERARNPHPLQRLPRECSSYGSDRVARLSCVCEGQ